MSETQKVFVREYSPRDREIARELIEIAKMPGDREPLMLNGDVAKWNPSSFITAHLVGTEELYAVQERIFKLIEKLDPEQAQKAFPWKYGNGRG